MTGTQSRQLPWKYAAGQFILIVVGVLVALSADSFRESWGEQRREATYLEDLLRELEVTLTIVDRAIAADSQHIVRSRSMLTYLRSTEDAPQDSLRQWRGVGWPGFATVTGTMRALLETGDLRLLSGEMRRSLTAYATDLDYTEREIDRAVAELMLAQRLVREREEIYTRWGRSDPGAGRAFTLNGPQMRTDPELRAAYAAALSWQQFHLSRLLNFRGIIMGFRKVFEAEGWAPTAVSTDTS